MTPPTLSLCLSERGTQRPRQEQRKGEREIPLTRSRGRGGGLALCLSVSLSLRGTDRQRPRQEHRGRERERENDSVEEAARQTDRPTHNLTDVGIMDPILPLTLRWGDVSLSVCLSESKRHRHQCRQRERERDNQTNKQPDKQPGTQTDTQTNGGGHDGSLALLCPAFPCFVLPYSALRGPILSVSLSLRETETPIPSQKQR